MTDTDWAAAFKAYDPACAQPTMSATITGHFDEASPILDYFTPPQQFRFFPSHHRPGARYYAWRGRVVRRADGIKLETTYDVRDVESLTMQRLSVRDWWRWFAWPTLRAWTRKGR